MVAYFSSKYVKCFQATFSVALLLFCLLGTHWVGFAHGISHSGLQSLSIEKCSAADSDGSITHSSDACHLYDALTLAGFIPVANSEVVAPSVNTSAMILPAELILIESTSAAYQSRAPPSFIL
ncbi:hypothetical protein C2740_04715 [Polynucleobacter sp. MG-5-Ahmo-C2]|jgi:hypothetical protein|uniref:hypothetical protein n=1 Tax=Polynucleobacter sp. MG-5-Ahmo-C2 TaxID=2081051 RepID=UPI001BFD4D58|nr:hypothetical protein [Polynucleobacter sp. MG-5-Ahmo-C2]QWD99360.1 hypothetical protein C2740_04715 [Polynucleobacter sp. MG-5-Ahmo-C2]